MIWSFRETLKFIEPHVPVELVLPETFDGIHAMANLLPAAMSAYYLECRLGPNATQVDFSICITGSEGGREIFAGDKTINSSPHLLNNPLWGRVCEFIKNWAGAASAFYQQIPFIWLEFDDINQPPPLPCVNLCLDPEYLERHSRSNHFYHPNTQQLQPFAIMALEQLLGHPIPSQTKQNMATCFDLLPPGSQFIYMAAMLPRNPPALKMNGLIPRDHLLDYLSRIGWPGSMVALEKIVTTFCSFMDEMRIGLTVGNNISSRLGLEFFSNTSTSPDQDSQRQILLSQLVEAELCTPEKRQALLNWSGFSSEIFSHQSWPTRLNRSWYVKLVYQDNYPLEAKGYLGFAPSLFSLFSLS